MDHIYHAAITINEGQKNGMSPEEIRLFCKWYTNLMAEKMEKKRGAVYLIQPAGRSILNMI